MINVEQLNGRQRQTHTPERKSNERSEIPRTGDSRPGPLVPFSRKLGMTGLTSDDILVVYVWADARMDERVIQATITYARNTYHVGCEMQSLSCNTSS